MRGFNTIWQPGYDHAGIATQNVIEKQLAKEGLTRHDLGREAFVERTWAWLEKYGGVIMGQLRRLGASLDYRRERMTMDEGYVRAVLKWFVHLARARIPLPGQPDRQLVPALRERDLRSRGQPRGDRRHAVRRSATHWPTAPATSGSRPCVRRRCSRMSRSPCTRTTTATATWSARRPCSRSSAGSCRSSRTSASTPSSARAR